MFERICIILLINIVFFAKTINYKYVSDDIESFRNPPKFKNKLHKRYLQILGQLKTNEQEDHLITILLHALVCVFIYLAFGKSDISFLAALLYSVNPINSQGSVWISGRGYVFSTLFILMAMTFKWASPLFLYCAAYFNLGFIMTLLAFLFLPFYLMPFIPLCLLAQWKHFFFHVKGKAESEVVGEDKKIHLDRLTWPIKTVGFYLIHSLIPIKITFYHSFMQSMCGNKLMKSRGYSKDIFFYIGIITIISILTYLITQPWSLISLAIIWWCVSIAPFSNLIRFSQEIAERYCYAPNVGLMFILASIIINYPIAIAIFLTMYATRLWFIMPMYKDNYWLAELACAFSPDSWFAWHVRGVARWDVRSFHEAVVLWVMAKMISPYEFKVLVNIAVVLRILKNDNEAMKYLKLAEENIPLGQEEESHKILERVRKGELLTII